MVAVRQGAEDPDRFGHGDVKGLWFIRVNVVRDAYAVNGREASRGTNGEKPHPIAAGHAGELPQVERLARRPEVLPATARPRGL